MYSSDLDLITKSRLQSAPDPTHAELPERRMLSWMRRLARMTRLTRR